jgi:hypothetical protein
VQVAYRAPLSWCVLMRADHEVSSRPLTPFADHAIPAGSSHASTFSSQAYQRTVEPLMVVRDGVGHS